MYTALSIFFFTVHIFFAFFVLYLCISFFTGAPFVPSNKNSVAAMIEIAKLKPGMKIYDLGSGDGRILMEATNKGAHAVGIEMNPYLVLWSRIRKLQVRWQSFWRTNISDADVIFVYLLPNHMRKLEKKLKRELRPGALVVSNSFIFPNLQSVRQDKKNHVYVFRVV
ncbi:MAG: hypothetical protein ACD_36C00073G0002 [uncultured bacterium]|uniref:DOT1 domain-containing protein n=1 Tax=Candidatus Gottesmanbacteria bacterium RIFCSPLOWO2_01_FULL_43_11b TaxID=1798392 RepID=A0A1F6AG51_9BACT|nr:MAG: hypothetical protein ACD_36C00073G0002 [uncultured bacterium]OGG23651.1 MAG: hypothetical protein A3A79_00385 [Candidatus Gottesmanbacteria bacterium RIFCSPLOWO2_01_FULL_43_11b]